MRRIHTQIAALALVVVSVLGCRSTRQIEETAEVQNPRPVWVSSRPISGAHYIGVGSASKVAEPLDYSNVAKQNALNDLASEISVKVEGESFLNTVEVNYAFSEEFNSAVRTSVSEHLEGYEIVNSWEDGDEYWVYYRLNKAEHARIKAEQKAEAIAASSDFFNKAIQAKEERKVRKSVQMHSMALLELKDYWTETNKTQWQGKEVYLDNEIYASLLDVVNGLTLSSPMTSVSLNASNGFEVNVPFTVELNGEAAGDVPVFYDFERANYKRPQGVYTDAAGLGSARVSDISRFESNNRLELQIDKETLFEGIEDRLLVKALEKQLTAERLSMPISMVLPKLHVSSRESAFDKLSQQKLLEKTAKNELTKMGFLITSNPNLADYTLYIESNSSEGGMTQGFHIAWLNMHMSVNDMEEHIVYETTATGVKGLQLNYGAASEEAYKKAAKTIRKEWIPNLLEIIL